MTEYLKCTYTASATVEPWVVVPGYDIPHAAETTYTQGFETTYPAVYTQGFETGLDGWAAFTGDTNLIRDFSAAHSGSWAAMVRDISSPYTTNPNSVSRTIDGLTIGHSYTLSAWVARHSTGVITQARVGVNGLAFGTPVVPTAYGTGWTMASYTFTATATSHALVLEHTHTSGPNALYNTAYWDDISLVDNSLPFDGWTVTGVATQAHGFNAHSGSRGMTLSRTSGTGNHGAERTVTGLTVGRSYTYKAWLSSNIGGATQTAQIGVVGKGNTTPVNALSSGWVEHTYTFTATATSHVLTVTGIYASSSSAWNVYADDITLVQDAWTEVVPPVTENHIEFPILDGEVTLDEGWSPHVQGRVEVPAIDLELLDRLDPRDEVRVFVEAAREGHSSRTYDLALRDREINHKAGTMSLTLASDEALLQDWTLVDNEGDTSATAYQSSLRSIINNVVLDKIGAALEPGTVDAPFYVLEASENLITNPGFEGTTAGWAAGTGATTLTAGAVSGYKHTGSGYGRWVTTSSGLSYLNAPVAPVTAGEQFTFTAWMRNFTGPRSMRLMWRYFTSAAMTTQVGADQLSTAITGSISAYTKYTATFTVPATATHVAFFPHAVSGSANDVHFIDSVSLVKNNGTPGIDYTAYFDGDTADTSDYGYNWTGTANASTSTRLVLIDRSPDLLRIAPGDNLWDFVEPLLAVSGFRLFCNELREWYLIDASYAVDAVVSIVEGFNALSGTDTVDLDDQTTGATGCVVKYSWRNAQGNSQTAYDYAGTSGNGFMVEYERPYPGPGAAAYILSRTAGRGRVQDVQALTDFSVTPGQEVAISLPFTVSQTGSVSAVTWQFNDDSMSVKSRALIDTPAESWFFDEPGVAWDEVPAGTDWSEDL